MPHNVQFEADDLRPVQAAVLEARMPSLQGPLDGPLLSGASATYRVRLNGLPPGRYRYHCLPHAALGERGLLIVE